MKVVGVFGANGFIGRHLVRRLSQAGVRTIAFGRHFPPDFATAVGGAVETRIIDLTDELETHARLQDVTDVVQLINSSNPAMGNRRLVPDLTFNVIPQVQFIESCVMAKVQSFLFLSSGGTVYGLPQSVPIGEDHPTEPLNSYGMTKLTVEKYLQMVSRTSGLGYNILRVSNPFGPGQTSDKGQGLVPTILRRHTDGQTISIFGDGTAERDYIYIDDVIDAIERAVERPPLGTVVNVGSGEGRSILDVITAVERELGTTIAREFVAGRATDTPSNVLDNRRARALLDWAPTVSFDEGMRRTVAAHLQA